MRLLSATTLCGAGGRATTALRALLGSVPAGPSSPASASSSNPACDSSGIGSVGSYTSRGGDARGCSSTELQPRALQLTAHRGSDSIRGSGATVNSGSSQFIRMLVLRGTVARLGCGSGGSDGLATRPIYWRRAALLHTSAGACGRETGGGDINNAAAGTREAPVEPPHEQHGNSAAILRELEDAERGGDPASVLQVVERLGHEFDEAALVAALRAVSHTAAGTGKLQPWSRTCSATPALHVRCGCRHLTLITTTIHSPDNRLCRAGGSEQPDVGGAGRLAANSTYQSLLSMVVAGSERLSPAQAVEVAASLGRLHLEDQMVLDCLGRNLVSRLHELSGSQLADLVEAYADSNASPGKVLADAVFNRWCDEFAEKHQGLKPKVDDVRRWHRENADKVWPDSNERPSVFSAVSHNKGRRVRGSKTCEYYKRYRAGKAAEQQPAALSGRRILAVTAAARKLNSDGSRGPGKRHAQDDDGSEEHAEGSHELPEKRRRMQPGHRGPGHGGSRGGGARGRRSSSEELSEDPSWASGGESSEDEEDSGGDGLGSGSMRASRHLLAQQQQQQGVHITVVRRDADGRATQAQPAAPPMLAGLLPLPGGPPLFQPPAGSVPGSSGRSVARPRVSNGHQRRGSAHGEAASEDPLACDEDASDGIRPQSRADSGSQQRRRSMPVDEDEREEEDGGQLQQAACEALATPVPPRAGMPVLPQAEQPKEGAATTVPQEAVGDAMDCKEQAQQPQADVAACGPGISEGSAHSGGGFAPPGCRGQSVPEATPKLLPIKEEREQACAAADDAQSSGQHAAAGAAGNKVEGNGLQPAVSECVSASTQNSGGPLASQGGRPTAQAPAAAEAAMQAQQEQAMAQPQAQNAPASPHSSAALLAKDAVDWATTGDGDTEATGCTHAAKQDALPLLPDATATTSSVATAPSAATVALPAPAAAAAAHGRCPSAGTTSDATGTLPAALAPLLTPDMSMNFAYMAAANAAAVNMATMAAAFLRAAPPLTHQQMHQQHSPGLPLPLPVSATPAAPAMPGAPPAVPQPLGSAGSVMSSFLLPPPPVVGSLPLPPALPVAAPPLLQTSTLSMLPPPLWHGMPTGMPPSMAAAAAVAAAPPLFQESPATVLGAPAGCNQLLPVMRLFMSSAGHSDTLAAAGAQPAPGTGATPPDGTSPRVGT
eukprot:XP_001693515.1 predicted protein [Chlamydomonas reinhardtii]